MREQVVTRHPQRTQVIAFGGLVNSKIRVYSQPARHSFSDGWYIRGYSFKDLTGSIEAARRAGR